jgi:DNA repair exonuclease SbcCD ATPase subunit
MKKQIILKALSLKNFKGIKELTVKIGPITDIYGDNGTGKTTIFDAFTWLLFDKDSHDRKNFDIKTLNSSNEVLHGLEHGVTARLVVDGREITLEKVHREKWTKRKGEAERTLTGNETLYYVDGIPLKQSEYQERVNSIIEESIFKLITNPLYFSTNMKWQERRKVLLGIIGDVAFERVLNYKSSLRTLEKLLFDKDMDTLRKSLALRKKKLNDDLKAIPYRIDEINNSIVELDFSALESELMEYKAYLNGVEEKLLDRVKEKEELLKNQHRLYELKSRLMDIEVKAKNEAQLPLRGLYEQLNSLEKETAKVESQSSKAQYKLQNNEAESLEIEKQLQELRSQWNEINEEILIIPEDSFICPTCRRTFEAEDIESKRLHMYENFNRNKAKKLSEVNASGKVKKERCQALKEELTVLKEALESLKKEAAELQSKSFEIKNAIDTFAPSVNLEANGEYQRIQADIEVIEKTTALPGDTNEEVAELKKEKAEFIKKVDECKEKLTAREQNERFKTRIVELLEEEKALAQKIAELEGQEFLCEEFIKTKVELLENSINSKFKFVRFKLFNSLVNGSVEECCEALINGVPFSSTNTASQINAGLDIINALSEHYGVEAPIFIDNRESINRILHCSSQIINLIVSEDSELKVESMESEDKPPANNNFVGEIVKKTLVDTEGPDF